MKRSNKMMKAAALLACLSAAYPTWAHVSFSQSEAAVGSRFKGVLQVPHGCKGSPTIQVQVQIPSGVLNVKPQPKAGWSIQMVKSNYARPYTLWGKPVSSGVTEITWTGALQNDHYDEFVFISNLSADLDPGQTLYFPVIQTCQEGQARWTGVQKQGHAHGHGHSHGADHSDGSAPALKLLPVRQ